MIQSSLLHVAVIMDGNGRWATARGLPRLAGHRAGVEALKRVTDSAPRFGIGTLTVYAFSADNWKRPRQEVAGLMRLLRAYLRTELARCVREGVRIQAIGRRDRLGPSVVRSVETAERATAGGTRLNLRIALDYSGREAIVRGETGPDVDLLIRTSGEQRLSDFLLWEAAYAELYFTPRLWPDFGAEDLAAALADFQRRQRRFGALPGTAA
jgi:undecaprenyl diphosphate synthase